MVEIQGISAIKFPVTTHTSVGGAQVDDCNSRAALTQLLDTNPKMYGGIVFMPQYY
jgi:hypothetical protein